MAKRLLQSYKCFVRQHRDFVHLKTNLATVISNAYRKQLGQFCCILLQGDKNFINNIRRVLTLNP